MNLSQAAAASLEAWQRYTSLGSIEARLLRPVVMRAWERSHAEHLDPRLLIPEHRSAREIDHLRLENAELIASASPYVEALAAAAGAERYATLLSARDATVLSVQGDPESMHGNDPAPTVGTWMDERHAGANGVGTALAEDQYVELTGTEHFISGFHHHTCHGIPLRGAAGEVVGALCLSVREPRVAHRLRRLLIMASRGVQMELAAARLRKRLQELRADPSDDSELLVLLYQEVVQAHAAARLQVEVGARRLGQVSGHDLVAAARHSMRRFERGARIWQLASGVAPEQPVSTAELLVWAAELMRTDAAIHHVELHAETDYADGRQASSAFAREVLVKTEHALRAVGERGAVELKLVAGGVRLRTRSRDEAFTREQCVELH
ncbi:MAG: hypothetical protein QM778_25755 [Myxococcales bacterium]